jgi:hypothetical protein
VVDLGTHASVLSPSDARVNIFLHFVCRRYDPHHSGALIASPFLKVFFLKPRRFEGGLAISNANGRLGGRPRGKIEPRSLVQSRLYWGCVADAPNRRRVEVTGKSKTFDLKEKKNSECPRRPIIIKKSKKKKNAKVEN